MTAVELGQSADPRALVPGDPARLLALAIEWRARAGALHEVGADLKRVDTFDAWSGRAVEEFRATFERQPRSWLVAGDSFEQAGAAIDRYASALEWAQAKAAEAAGSWARATASSDEARAAHGQAMAGGRQVAVFTDPGESLRADATRLLGEVREEVARAGDRAAAVLAGAGDGAPSQPTLFGQVATQVVAVGGVVGDAAAEVANVVASLGNAVLNHPGELAGRCRRDWVDRGVRGGRGRRAALWMPPVSARWVGSRQRAGQIGRAIALIAPAQPSGGMPDHVAEEAELVSLLGFDSDDASAGVAVVVAVVDHVIGAVVVHRCSCA